MFDARIMARYSALVLIPESRDNDWLSKKRER